MTTEPWCHLTSDSSHPYPLMGTCTWQMHARATLFLNLSQKERVCWCSMKYMRWDAVAPLFASSQWWAGNARCGLKGSPQISSIPSLEGVSRRLQMSPAEWVKVTTVGWIRAWGDSRQKQIWVSYRRLTSHPQLTRQLSLEPPPSTKPRCVDGGAGWDIACVFVFRRFAMCREGSFCDNGVVSAFSYPCLYPCAVATCRASGGRGWGLTIWSLQQSHPWGPLSIACHHGPLVMDAAVAFALLFSSSS